jgi:CHAD domain-containing protein
MKKKEIGEYLFRFYRKRCTSFLAYIYKASLTADTKDIHRARLDVKKLFALYGLFDMADHHAFRQVAAFTLFNPLYRAAGKIREIQVTCLMLPHFQQDPNDFYPFSKWLKERERVQTLKFIREVKRFNEKKLRETEKGIGKICDSNSVSKLKSKTIAFIRAKAQSVREILAGEQGEEDLHTIRKNLKAMSTIATLVYSVRGGKRLEMIISGLNRTEMMIGDWHDRVVLKDLLDQYKEKNKHLDETELLSLDRLYEATLGQSRNLVLHFIPEVDRVIRFILEPGPE